MKYLVTGTAGFIGFHLTKRLLEIGETVVGIDNLNDYYDVRIKHARLKELGIFEIEFEYNKIVKSQKYTNFKFAKIDITEKTTISKHFENESFDIVCNFAAQAGIMYSTINPEAYKQSNIIGFQNIIDCCKEHKCKLIYASSSSVYGENAKIPFSENDTISTPKNYYAETKIFNEQLAEKYSKEFEIETIGLRLFSVYGTFGRPDMAYMIFAKSILNNQSINIYGDGSMKRDLTFVEDVVTTIEKLIAYSAEHKLYNEIFNIGSTNPIPVLELIEFLENLLETKAIRNYLPQRYEEIQTTFADTSKLENFINYKPNSPFDKGLKKFVEWYKQFKIKE